MPTKHFQMPMRHHIIYGKATWQTRFGSHRNHMSRPPSLRHNILCTPQPSALHSIHTDYDRGVLTFALDLTRRCRCHLCDVPSMCPIRSTSPTFHASYAPSAKFMRAGWCIKLQRTSDNTFVARGPSPPHPLLRGGWHHHQHCL